MYELRTTSRFDKDYKKLSLTDKAITDEVIDILLSGKPLSPKHKDHALQGNLQGFRDCHIKPNLILIYRINNKDLEIFAMRIGSHSKLFKS